MGELSEIMDALSLLKGLADLFSNQPSLADIITLILTEIQNIFPEDLASNDLRTATGR